MDLALSGCPSVDLQVSGITWSYPLMSPISCRLSSASLPSRTGALRIHPSPSPSGHTSCFPGHWPSSHYDPNGPGGQGRS